MKTLRNHRYWFHLVIVFMFIFVDLHCGSTTVGNPEAIDVEFVGLRGEGPPALSVLAQTIIGGNTITEARIVLSRLEFRPLDVCQDETENEGNTDIRFMGPFIVNLLTDVTTPDPGNAEIPSGTYCRIELRLDGPEEDERPEGIDPDDPILQKAVIIRGQTNDGTDFTVLSEMDEEFKIENEIEGFPVGLDGVSTLFIAFDLTTWLTGVDFNSATVNGDGDILIDKDNNSSLLEVIEDNIELSSRLFEDQNEDGELDDDEVDEDDVLAEGEMI